MNVSIFFLHFSNSLKNFRRKSTNTRHNHQFWICWNKFGGASVTVKQTLVDFSFLPNYTKGVPNNEKRTHATFFGPFNQNFAFVEFRFA